MTVVIMTGVTGAMCCFERCYRLCHYQFLRSESLRFRFICRGSGPEGVPGPTRCQMVVLARGFECPGIDTNDHHDGAEQYEHRQV